MDFQPDSYLALKKKIFHRYERFIRDFEDYQPDLSRYEPRHRRYQIINARHIISDFFFISYYISQDYFHQG